MYSRRPIRTKISRKPEIGPIPRAVANEDDNCQETNRPWVVWTLISEFCANSTVPGVRYFTEDGRHWSERVWWLVSFLFALFLCWFSIEKIYTKWDQTPVIVTLDETSAWIWEIPFPAVTICPESKVKIMYLNYTNVFSKIRRAKKPPYDLANDEIDRMEALIQICQEIQAIGIKFGNDFSDRKILDRIEEVAPHLHETMIGCTWGNTDSSCSFFEPILTEEGLCFTFNAFNSDEIYRNGMNNQLKFVKNNPKAANWNLEDGYNKYKSNLAVPYPFCAIGAGPTNGLYTNLYSLQKNLRHGCRRRQGFKITLHAPDEVPWVRKQSFRVPLNYEVIVAVKPKLITTAESLRQYGPNWRKCYFESERELKFFKVYSQRNCDLECLANFTEVRCGCTKFSMPRDADTKICGVPKMQCLIDAENELALKLFLEHQGQCNLSCNCLPMCTSITYDAEITRTKHKTEIAYGVNHSNVRIYFKDAEFVTSLRSELYGQTDFVAYCGGLLGLFMGISLLSIIEIVYYCTLRLVCELRSRYSRQPRNRDASAETGNSD